jgi:hypothetical protein
MPPPPNSGVTPLMTDNTEIAVNGPQGSTSEPISSSIEGLASLGPTAEQRQARYPLRDGRPAVRFSQQSPKKRKADEDSTVCFPVHELTDEIENAMTRTLRCFATDRRLEDVQSLRNEMKVNMDQIRVQLSQLIADAVTKVQVEADKRVEAVIQRLKLAFNVTPKDGAQSVAPPPTIQQKQAGQSTWASIARGGMGPQVNEWTTVSGHKTKRKTTRVLKKHSKNQRRVLFSREQDSPQCSDPRTIMLEINKALQVEANATVRLIEMRYTRKGHLSGVVDENARADDLLEHTTAVIVAA